MKNILFRKYVIFDHRDCTFAKFKVKGQILNYLVNASPLKTFDVATLNFVAK